MTVDEVIKIIVLELTPSEREELFARLREKFPDDNSSILISIEDWFGPDRERPAAILIRKLDRIEIIDIIASIRQDPLSLGHPAILFAIERWVRIMQYQVSRSNLKLKRGNEPYSPSEVDFYDIAETHLRNVAKALLESAKEHKLSKSEMFAVYAEYSYPEYLLLRTAWEALADSAIKNAHNANLKLTMIKERILNGSPVARVISKRDRRPYDSHWMKTVEKNHVDPIIKFIKQKNLHRRKRGKWIAMMNAFDAWRTGLSVGTVEQYRRMASKSDLVDEIDPKFLWPGNPNADETLTYERVDWLNHPVVRTSSILIPSDDSSTNA
jgi:hypothetical protein